MTPQLSDTHPEIKAIELKNARGDSAVVLTLGAILAELNFSSTSNGCINTILGYPHHQNYVQDTAYLGVIAGRYCNRIAHSAFTLNGHGFSLQSNEGAHQLHGGPQGFHRQHWRVVEQTPSHVTLHLQSPDGDQGYPGELSVQLTYSLGDDSCLDISWEAESDKDTVLNLTSHAYFNLAGHGDTREHWLRIPATHYTPTDALQIPTGEIRSVADSSFDLQQFVCVQDILNSDDPEIRRHGGLDHNWARGAPDKLLLSAELLCPETGLLLQASSTLPGLQCYTGNHLGSDGSHTRHSGICLEPQYYPNSPNEPDFPQPLLRRGETMKHRIRYQFYEVDPIETLSLPPRA